MACDGSGGLLVAINRSYRNPHGTGGCGRLCAVDSVVGRWDLRLAPSTLGDRGFSVGCSLLVAVGGRLWQSVVFVGGRRPWVGNGRRHWWTSMV